MKYCLLLICSMFASLAMAGEAPLRLMPYPQQLEVRDGQLLLDQYWTFAIEGDDRKVWERSLNEFAARLERQGAKPIGWRLAPVARAELRIHILDGEPMSPNVSDWDESYSLHISANAITLEAKQRLGALRGLETLLQLAQVNEGKTQLTQLRINDYPRFKWRGLLLDTSRHFFSVETIKRQLDAMASAKYNIFHWHLTDDQGWRLESKRYPKLHQEASDGEFYTQSQIRELVAYAQERGIQILPEIDVPGHASAIAVAYPELMSAPGPYSMEYHWGVHKPTLDPTQDEVYAFVDGLVQELVALFPFEYIHIGGDEVDPEHWNNSESIKAFMQANDLADHHALQAYFNQRVQKILKAHKRKMIGWDEIQHPDLPKDIVIQSWQGPDGVSDAVSHGFQALLSTGYYLDQPQDAAYHYRNDPIPPTPVKEISAADAKQARAWDFSLPRKRGKPVTGQFILGHGNHAGADQSWGYVDFSGKSRRPAYIKSYDKQHAVFSLDTWMGVVEFRVVFNAKEVSGTALVGNAPYQLTGKQLAQIPVTPLKPVAHLSASQEALILGGEAALWAEIVDEHSIDLRLWPRAFVVAERLWSARDLLDESDLYKRMFQIDPWSQQVLGLEHGKQQQNALVALAGNAADAQALAVLAEALQPAYYYHRQHEKSANESYSKADPLNRLVDALPAESEALIEIESLMQDWLANPAKNSDYKMLNNRLMVWQKNYAQLLNSSKPKTELLGVVSIANSVSEKIQSLMKLHVAGEVPSKEELNEAKATVAKAIALNQEMVVASGFILEQLIVIFE